MKMRNFTDDTLKVHLFDYDVSDIVANMPPDEDPIWALDTRRQEDPAWGLGATKSIIFKWFVDPNFDWKHSQDVDPFVDKFHMDTELWALAKPLVEQIEAHHNGVAVRAYYSQLDPQSEVDRHGDGDCLLVPLVSKNIVALETNADDVVEINGFQGALPVGGVYEFDNINIHTEINRGLTRTVYLIVDVLPNDFQECIVSGGYGEYPVTNLYRTNRTIAYTANTETGRVDIYRNNA
jgi:hypothetical protein